MFSVSTRANCAHITRGSTDRGMGGVRVGGMLVSQTNANRGPSWGPHRGAHEMWEEVGPKSENSTTCAKRGEGCSGAANSSSALRDNDSRILQETTRLRCQLWSSGNGLKSLFNPFAKALCKSIERTRVALPVHLGGQLCYTVPATRGCFISGSQGGQHFNRVSVFGYYKFFSLFTCNEVQHCKRASI